MTRRELLLETFDEHIILLRILARRFLEADRIEDAGSLLAPDWRSLPNWYNSLWLFELEGIKASGYPGVIDDGDAANYATPQKFVRFASRLTFLLPLRNRTPWTVQWRALPLSEVELDPRYVAFRTIFDWIVLSAKVLAERGDAFDDGEVDVLDWKPTERKDPFKQDLPRETGPDEVPIGLSCGNPRERLVGGRLFNHWEPNFLEPEWRDVQRPWAAIRYQHYRGLQLPMELRNGALREHYDPRLAQLEFLEPETFREFVAGVLTPGDDIARSQAWLKRSVEDVRGDPRFIAHKCGFDSQMILHMVRKAREDAKPKGKKRDPNSGVASQLMKPEWDAFVSHALDLGITLEPPPDDEEKPN